MPPFFVSVPRRCRQRGLSGGTLLASGLMVGLLSACGGGGGFPSLNGAGATFPAAAYQRWANDFSARSGGRVMYQSVGSGAGVRQFLAGTVDFGATDEALSEEEFKAAARRGVVQIPMLGGTVTPAYNQPACKALRLTQAQLTEIFEGTLKDWQQLGCGSGPITVVHRSDGSGTTFAFTNALSCFSERWKSQVGKGKSVSWPVGVGAKGNEGVAAAIANSPGAIGYVNQAYVRGPIQAAALQNRDGQFVLADAASGAAGLNAVQLDGRLGGSQCNPAGARSFPIVAFTWILAYGHGNGEAKAKALRSFLDWGLAEKAQAQAAQLGYVPLQGGVLAKARAAVARIVD